MAICGVHLGVHRTPAYVLVGFRDSCLVVGIELHEKSIASASVLGPIVKHVHVGGIGMCAECARVGYYESR